MAGDNHPLLHPYPKQPTGLIVNTPAIASTALSEAQPLHSITTPSLVKLLEQTAASDDEVTALDDQEAADIRRAIELVLAVILS